MKKLFIAASLIAASFAANAQNQTTTPAVQANTPILSKRGYAILPEAGDWGIAYDAAPALSYFGNLLHGQNASAAPGTNYASAPGVNTQVITGKYFLSATTAIRARVRIGLGSTSSKTDVGSTTGTGQVANETKTSYTAITLAAGIEKRKGIGRVQGFYGAEFVISTGGGGNSKYTYGNAIANGQTLTTQTKTGGTFGLGPRGFIGVEYFIAPKFSIGGEFGWSIMFSSIAKSTSTSETDNAGTTKSTTTTSTTAGQGGGSSIIVDTDNLNGSINLNFYF